MEENNKQEEQVVKMQAQKQAYLTGAKAILIVGVVFILLGVFFDKFITLLHINFPEKLIIYVRIILCLVGASDLMSAFFLNRKAQKVMDLF